MFNPFGKPLGELKEADLGTLIAQSVAEGYYVEYKASPPNKTKIGHSIASFANTNGGWYVIGVTADAHNVATAANGFPTGQLADPTATIRDVIRGHVHPVPLFALQVVSLASGNIVVVVSVAENQDAPFLTNDGRIYRRTADSSDPIPETDRHALDRLYERGRQANERFAAFCHDERAHSKAEEEQGWASVYLSPYPYGGIDRSEILSSDGVGKLIEQSRTQQTFLEVEGGKPLTGNLPFDGAYSRPDSVVLQQRATNRIEYNSLSVELLTDGRVRFHVPLAPRPMAPRFADVNTNSARTALMQRFPDPLDPGLHWLRFVDLGQTCLAVGSLVNWYLAWLGSDEVAQLDVAVRLDGVWRSVPFIDSEEWSRFVDRFGLPVQRSGRVSFPRGEGESIRFDLEHGSQLWMHTCVAVAQAMGFPADVGSRLVAEALIEAAARGGPPPDSVSSSGIDR